MYLRISPSDGEIHVSAPVNMPLKEIEIFVREKWSWILEARKRLEKARKNTAGEQLSEEEEKLQKKLIENSLWKSCRKSSENVNRPQGFTQKNGG